MNRIFRKIRNQFTTHTPDDKELIRSVHTITGYYPVQLSLYHLAVLHSSIAVPNEEGRRESNERLEYLGDAILGACVADFLFMKYPFQDEGFLTEIRSRIVNRESLNAIGKKLGVNRIVRFDRQKKGRMTHKSLYGDTLEALIGAVYLDQGYKRCKRFILTRLIQPYVNIEELVRLNPNYKSTLIEYAQREGMEIEFRIIDTKKVAQHREFCAEVVLDGIVREKGYGYSKKKAEQDAAEKTCVAMKLIKITRESP